MFEYEVYTEEEAENLRFSLLEEGIYKGKIKSCIISVSQSSGNNMFDMVIEVCKGKVTCDIRTFLSFTPKMAWKIRHCVKSAGLLKEYENKTLTDKMLIGKSVCVKVGKDAGQIIPIAHLNGKPEGSCYPDKNIIVDFLENDDIINKHDITDDIPF